MTQKYQLENIAKSKWVKLGGAFAALGAGGGGALGRILAKTVPSVQIGAVILWPLISYLDVLLFVFVSYYILMYRHLKKHSAEYQNPDLQA